MAVPWTTTTAQAWNACFTRCDRSETLHNGFTTDVNCSFIRGVEYSGVRLAHDILLHRWPSSALLHDHQRPRGCTPVVGQAAVLRDPLRLPDDGLTPTRATGRQSDAPNALRPQALASKSAHKNADGMRSICQNGPKPRNRRRETRPIRLVISPTHDWVRGLTSPCIRYPGHGLPSTMVRTRETGTRDVGRPHDTTRSQTQHAQDLRCSQHPTTSRSLVTQRKHATHADNPTTADRR